MFKMSAIGMTQAGKHMLSTGQQLATAPSHATHAVIYFTEVNVYVTNKINK